ncbi:hypothetical protein CHUAL_006164 [Chamberlinius hualienensis]
MFGRRMSASSRRRASSPHVLPKDLQALRRQQQASRQRTTTAATVVAAVTTGKRKLLIDDDKEKSESSQLGQEGQGDGGAEEADGNDDDDDGKQKKDEESARQQFKNSDNRRMENVEKLKDGDDDDDDGNHRKETKGKSVNEEKLNDRRSVTPKDGDRSSFSFGGRLSRPSLSDVHQCPTNLRMKRRRAVTQSDYKTCALVQTKLKFGDIALSALSAEAALNAERDVGGDSDTLSFSGRNGAMAPRRGAQAHGVGEGPTSLFIFSEKNAVRRYTRFIIEWPYPFNAKMVD